MWYNEGKPEGRPSLYFSAFFGAGRGTPPGPLPGLSHHFATGDDMRKPKLIASDIDGTLIPYGRFTLPEELFPLIRRLERQGVLFCPASGRQYHSLRRLFAPVADEICCLCENGAAVFGPGREDAAPLLSLTAMPRKDALEIARQIAACPPAEAVISGPNTTYTCGAGERLSRDLDLRLHNNVRALADFSDIAEEIIKVSAFCPEGTEKPLGILRPRWGEAYQAAVSGPHWIDFNLADKGLGLRALCRSLSIDPGDVWAFGDNYNDVSMLLAAGTPWLMDTADRALLERFPRHCRNVPEELEKLLDALE